MQELSGYFMSTIGCQIASFISHEDLQSVMWSGTAVDEKALYCTYLVQ